MASSQQAADPQVNPRDVEGLCILSLDGGGIRGLSSLFILQALMAKVNAARRDAGEEPVKPCQVFDLIGGSSTGGIIAILLGRLRMDVAECIAAYLEFSKSIFQDKSRLPFGKFKGCYSSDVMKECIERVIQSKSPELPDNPLLTDSPGSKVAVCAIACSIRDTVLLRSYKAPENDLDDTEATISEAARATAAATSFFEPVAIGPYGTKYASADLGTNNPIHKIWNEAQVVWCSGRRLEAHIKCFVSIGTGVPSLTEVGNTPKEIYNTLKTIATETEETADDFAKTHKNLVLEKRYFRFSVQNGLQDVSLDDITNIARIHDTTRRYMGQGDPNIKVTECAVNLKSKQALFKTTSLQSIEKVHTSIPVTSSAMKLSVRPAIETSSDRSTFELPAGAAPVEVDASQPKRKRRSWLGFE